MSDFNRNSKGQFAPGNTVGFRGNPDIQRKVQESRRKNKLKESDAYVEVSNADYQLLKRVKETIYENEVNPALTILLGDIPNGFKQRIRKAIKNNLLFEELDLILEEYGEDRSKMTPAQRKWLMWTVCVNLLPNEPLGKLREAVLLARKVDADLEARIEAAFADLED